MEAIKTFDVDGASVRIVMDKDPEDPRNWDNLGTLALYHRRYSLGDEHKPPMEEAKLIEKDKDYICLKVYGYDHGGLVFQTTPYSCPWDSGRLGIIYVHKDDVRKEYDTKRIDLKTKNLVLRRLLDEVKVYDQYLAGDVYGYKVTVGDEEDSCWSFYGLDECKKEAEGIAHHMLRSVVIKEYVATK
jgi:hypothetical protein